MEIGALLPPPLSVDLAKIEGVIKSQPEDFVVEEIPSYQPCGEGEHLYLWVEKRDVSAEELVRDISATAGVSRNDVGIAGMKDRFAVTRQLVSIPAKSQPNFANWKHDQIKILSQDLHGNKLRSGHLRGNKFEIVVRRIDPEMFGRIEPIVDFLHANGIPNLFGRQRFGRQNETLKTGFDLITGRLKPGKIPRSRRKFLLRLALSSVQSYLFNQYVGARIEAGFFRQVLLGDVMEVRASGGKFIVEDVAAEQARFEQGETSITGPIYGPKMKQPTDAAAELEADLLEKNGLSAEDFARFQRLTTGSRRAIALGRVEIDWDIKDSALTLRFELPSGSYATVVLREFLRKEIA
ncbi:MAG: tRNA pseudouridine(13) synthase TruD [bacterium]|nr:tRNA pseudouridine(13) synthase TruD [bacterium]